MAKPTVPSNSDCISASESLLPSGDVDPEPAHWCTRVLSKQAGNALVQGCPHSAGEAVFVVRRATADGGHVVALPQECGGKPGGAFLLRGSRSAGPRRPSCASDGGSARRRPSIECAARSASSWSPGAPCGAGSPSGRAFAAAGCLGRTPLITAASRAFCLIAARPRPSERALSPTGTGVLDGPTQRGRRRRVPSFRRGAGKDAALRPPPI